MVAQPRAFRTVRCSAAPDLQPFNFANAAPSEVCDVAGLGGRGAGPVTRAEGKVTWVPLPRSWSFIVSAMRLRLQIDLDHPDLDDVAGLDDLARILDEAVGQLRDVDEAVLVHADVDERAEVGDVGHDAFEQHARLRDRQIACTPSLNAAVLNSGRGSRPGFSSSARMSLTVGTPNCASANSSGLQRAQHRRACRSARGPATPVRATMRSTTG